MDTLQRLNKILTRKWGINKVSKFFLLIVFLLSISLIYTTWSLTIRQDFNFQKKNDRIKQEIINITDDMILSNPIYSQFNIIPTKKKKNVTLLLIVSSGPKRFERRQAIRDTYWKQCHSSKEVSSYITE